MSTVEKKDVAEFYDTFLEGEEAQMKLKIRHYKVFHELRKAGLRRDHKVLEVGCGFGTVTSLIAPYVKRGKILAVDISPNRVEAAKKHLSKYKQAEFLVSDMSDFTTEDKFDFIVMPDVLEHIPLEEHDRLFKTFSNVLKPGGSFFLHIPHPLYLDYQRTHNPDLLQIIDQSLYAELYMDNIAKNGFYLSSLRSYCLGQDHHDYQFIVFKKIVPYSNPKTLPTNTIRWRKLRYRLFAWWSRL
jgi:cyclopropane fatty-acyl-phospholipid synthase-like methyltransferase